MLRPASAFVVAGFVTNLGSGVLLLTGAFLTFGKVHSDTAVSLLFVLSTLPQALLSLGSIALRDTAALRRGCVSADLFRASCCLCLAVVWYAGRISILALYLVTFLISCADAVSVPGLNTWAQRAVPPEHHADFSRRFELSFNVGQLLSSAVGGILIGVAGIGIAFVVNVATYLASATALTLAGAASRASSGASDGPMEAARTPVAAPSPEVPRRPRQTLVLWGTLFAQGRTMATVLTSLLVPLVIGRLGRGVVYLGLVDGGAGLGVVVAVRALRRWVDRDQVRNALVGYLAMGVLTLPLGVVGAVALPVLLGCAMGVFGVARIGMRRQLMDASRDAGSESVYGLANTLSVLLGAVLSLACGFLADTTTIGVAFAAIGGWLLVVTVLFGVPLLRARAVAVTPTGAEVTRRE